MTRAWLEQIESDASVRKLVDAIDPSQRVMAEGSWGSSGHLLAGMIARQSKRPVLLVVAHLDEADEAKEDLELLEGVTTETFGALELMPGESHVSLELLAERLTLVGQLMEQQQPSVVIAPVQALMQAVPQAEAIGAMARQLKPGQTLDQHELTEWLADAGYNRVDGIEEPGDFAIRGGIVDVMPPGNLPPVRIDFFGDQIDEITEVNPDTMGSGRKLEGVRLIGASPEKIQDEERTTNF
ncbi:MAG: hypothetical protein WD079_00455 [Phycisphaeraceae bacterium]